MLFNNTSSSVNHYFPLGQIKGFDQISPDVMECIGEYVGCLAPQDQSSWSVYRNTHYFHALFKPRIHEERRRRIEQWENELNAGFSLFQNFKKTMDLSLVRDQFNQAAVDVCKQTGNTNMLTLREYWLEYLNLNYQNSLTHVFRRHIFYNADEKVDEDLAIVYILSACTTFDPENNGGPKSVVPMRYLREMAQSMQKTADTDISSFCFSDLNSHEVQIVTMRNIQSHSCFKKLSSCCLGVCLIAKHLLNVVYPHNFKFFTACFGSIFSALVADWICSRKIIKVLNNRKNDIVLLSLTYVAISVMHISHHHGSTIRQLGIIIRQLGIMNALLHQREPLKEAAERIKFIWHTRELLTDIFIKGMAAHISIAMKSMGRTIRRLQ